MNMRPHRIGPWVFITALAWYIAICFFANMLDKQNLSKTQGAHKNVEVFDISNASVLEIHPNSSKSQFRYREIKVTYQPSVTGVTVHNEDLGIVVTGSMNNNTFTLKLDSIATRHQRSEKPLEILVPASVHTLKVSDSGNLEISGNLPPETGGLDLILLDYTSSIVFDNFTTSRLAINSTSPATDKRCSCSLGDVHVKSSVKLQELDVSMRRGSFQFSADPPAKKTVLNIGTDVTITGYREFLQSAIFTQLK